jgi:hypothetical protein
VCHPESRSKLINLCTAVFFGSFSHAGILCPYLAALLSSNSVSPLERRVGPTCDFCAHAAPASHLMTKSQGVEFRHAVFSSRALQDRLSTGQSTIGLASRPPVQWNSSYHDHLVVFLFRALWRFIKPRACVSTLGCQTQIALLSSSFPALRSVCLKLWLPMPCHRRHPLRRVALLSKRYEPPRFEADFSILCLVQTR